MQPTNSNGVHVCFIIAIGDTRQWFSSNLLTSPRGIGLSTILFQKNCNCLVAFFQRQEQWFSHCVLDVSLQPVHQMRNVMFSASRGVTVTLHPMTMTPTLASASPFAYKSGPAVLECQVDFFNHWFTCLKNSPPRSVSNIQILPKSILKLTDRISHHRLSCTR